LTGRDGRSSVWASPRQLTAIRSIGHRSRMSGSCALASTCKPRSSSRPTTMTAPTSSSLMGPRLPLARMQEGVSPCWTSGRARRLLEQKKTSESARRPKGYRSRNRPAPPSVDLWSGPKNNRPFWAGRLFLRKLFWTSRGSSTYFVDASRRRPVDVITQLGGCPGLLQGSSRRQR
jgi:hypothetical protein